MKLGYYTFVISNDKLEKLNMGHILTKKQIEQKQKEYLKVKACLCHLLYHKLRNQTKR